MESMQGWCSLFLLLVSLLPHLTQCSNIGISAKELDAIIRDHAFQTLVRKRTGVVYNVSLPTNLRGIEASVVRMRGKSFWNKGFDVDGGAVHIPPKTVLVPPVRRWVVVRQNLGNWSFLYDHNITGYHLVTPVVGLLAYDDSNISSASTTTELDLVVTGDPIIISFPALPAGLNRTKAKCTWFGSRGAVIGDMGSMGYCLTKRTGHFAVVVPLDVREGGGRRWVVLVVACGVVGLVLVVGLVWLGICKLRMMRMEEMGKETDNGEALGSLWVGRSKMPSAAMVRTQPAVEN